MCLQGELREIDLAQFDEWKKQQETEKAKQQKSKSNLSDTQSIERNIPEHNWNQFHEEHFLRIAEEFEGLMQKMRLKNPQDYFMKFIR